MPGVAAVNTDGRSGGRSSDCGSTFQQLIKAQRDVTKERRNEGAGKDIIRASFSATSCLRVSATFKSPSRMPAPGGRVDHEGMLTTDFAKTALSEGERSFFDL